MGGKPQAAYETAVPVTLVQFSTYIIFGLMAAFAGIAITMLSGSGNAEIGAAMTLASVTAVVIGGTALNGGVVGSADGRTDTWDHSEHYLILKDHYMVGNIGGGVSQAGNLLINPIRRTLRERVTIMPIDQVEVVLSQLGDNAGVIGVACWVAKES